MAFDCFLKIDGIEGESGDEKHLKWIEVLSYNHGVSQPSGGALSNGGGRSAERCDHTDFSVTKTLDMASPKLFLFCCNGKKVANVKVELCRATEKKEKYMEYRMTDVVISNVRMNGQSSGAEALPLEDVSFSYAKIELIYTSTSHKTGGPGGDVKSFWDLKGNRGG